MGFPQHKKNIAWTALMCLFSNNFQGKNISKFVNTITRNLEYSMYYTH